MKIAALRYRMIAEAVESLGGDVAWAIEEAARHRYPDPDGGGRVGVTPRTLWRFLAAYREGGLLALQPKVRKDRGQVRAISPEVLEAAARLRRENENRPTKTIIDILERTHEVGKGELARATLDRHLDKMGLSRRRLHRLGKTTYKKILTEAPFELVVADFHHGPYVRVGDDGQARRALLLAFIDHFSRYVPQGRYYLHEDFAALRFGFRHLLLDFGSFVLLYIDNGPSFQTHRFHAASTSCTTPSTRPTCSSSTTAASSSGPCPSNPAKSPRSSPRRPRPKAPRPTTSRYFATTTKSESRPSSAL